MRSGLRLNIFSETSSSMQFTGPLHLRLFLTAFALFISTRSGYTSYSRYIRNIRSVITIVGLCNVHHNDVLIIIKCQNSAAYHCIYDTPSKTHQSKRRVCNNRDPVQVSPKSCSKYANVDMCRICSSRRPTTFMTLATESL